MDEEYITPESLPGEEVQEAQANQNVPSADGNEAVSEVTEEVISLSEIEATLGKKFPDKATALKSWKDTQSYVGKKIEAIKPNLEQDVALIKQELATSKFYNEKPEYNNPTAKELITALGGDPATAVTNPVFKKAYDALKSRDESQNSKSVLNTNSRIAQVSNDMEADFESLKVTGDWVGFLKKHKGVDIKES